MSNCGQSAGKTPNRIKKISKEIGYYLSGFADGEGSFNVSVVNRKKDYKHGWKISLSFNISQKDDTIPHLFRKILGCGIIRYRKDGICYFETRSVKDLSEIIVPFFQNFHIRSNKKIYFGIFCKILSIVKKKEHLNKKGMNKILKLRDLMVVSRKRKYTNIEILESY